MTRSFTLVAALALASCTSGNTDADVHPTRSAQTRTTAFTHVTVIDGRSPTPHTDRTVVVSGTRIVAEGPASRVEVPDGARVIDGRGKFLIPGLWDMHVHTVVPRGREVLALYVANGVTGIRDMAGVWDTLTAWRREINAGTLTGPRIVASGPYLEGGPVPIPHILVRAPGDAKSAVDRLAAMRTDFIKVHGQLTRENYFAIARAARAKGIPFVGHLPRTVSAAEASDSGQRSLEHLLRIPNQCAVGDSARLAPRFPIQSVFGECTRRDLGPLFSRFVRNDTWIVPTLVAAFDIATWPKRVLPGDAYAHYLPDTLRRYVAAVFAMPPNIPADADVVGRELFQKRVSIVGAMHRAGVPIMTGTDAPLPNSPPGFGLHHELELFVEAGFSPHAALRAATSAPARFLHASDSLGTIERSKVADLVLLDANPLDDIRNTRRTVDVMANGRLFEVQRDARRAFVALVSR